MKIINEKTDVSEAGAIIENGRIQAYKTVDLTDLVDHVKELRKTYDPSKHKNFHHIARLDADVLENIRLANGWPQTPEGQNLAVKEAVRMVKSGELSAFAVHGA
jgi:hypothetical protein